MQNLIVLILAAFFVYLLFFRKGGMGSGMGMGCCGGHGGHGDHDRQDKNDGHCGHGTETDKARHLNELSEGRKEEIIDLREDQYTVLTVEEDKSPKAADRIVSHKSELN
jgi:hypothetical protein